MMLVGVRLPASRQETEFENLHPRDLTNALFLVESHLVTCSLLFPIEGKSPVSRHLNLI